MKTETPQSEKNRMQNIAFVRYEGKISVSCHLSDWLMMEVGRLVWLSFDLYIFAVSL